MTPQLTGGQAEAVTRRSGSLLVSANAGSGKTTVLAERYLRTVLEDGIPPPRILALTFTDKAAGELRHRIRARLMADGGREHVRSLDHAWISTFHALCARILRAHAVRVGIDPRFAVLDEAEARALRQEAFDRALGDVLDAGGPETLDIAAAYGADRMQTMVQGAYGQLRSRGQREPRLALGHEPPAPDPVPLRRLAGEALATLEDAAGKTVGVARERLTALCELLDAGRGQSVKQVAACVWNAGNTKALSDGPPAIAREALGEHIGALEAVLEHRALAVVDLLLGAYGAAYDAAKRGRNALDFEDLELFTRDLLRDDDGVRARYRDRFQAVMVDEFQDTNPLQLELLDLLAEHRFVVGDVLQSIYGFRHADVSIFRAEREQRGRAGETVELAGNHRTVPEILGVIDRAFGAAHGLDHVPFTATRDAAGESVVELLLADRAAALPDDDEPLEAAPWRVAEARLLAARIAELVDGGTAPGDIAVLLRSLTELHVYEAALEERGLRTLAVAGGGYWGRTHVLDLCAYLATLANPADELALFGLLAGPLVGLSSDGLAIIATELPAGKRWLGLVGAFGDDAAGELSSLLGAEDRDRLAARIPWLAGEREQAPRRQIAAMIDRVIGETGYDRYVAGLVGGERRLANVRKLRRLAAAYEARHGRDLRGFVDRARAELDAGAREADAPVTDADGSAVAVMSIHAAKGLEFPVVAVADLGHKRASESGELLVAGDGAAAVRVRTLDGYGETPAGLKALREQVSDAGLEEERRIFHVAMTRARDRLILSGACAAAPDRQSPGGWIITGLAPDLFDRLAEHGDSGENLIYESGGVVVTVARDIPAAPPHPASAPAAPLSPEPPPAGAEDGSGQLSLLVTAPVASSAPVVPRPVPPTLSYSSLSRFGRCSYRFHLERDLGLPENAADPLMAPAPAAAGLDALTRGSLVHLALERADLGAGAPGADGVAALLPEPDLNSDAAAEIARLVGAALDAPLMERVRAAWRLRREQQFVIDVAGDSAPLVHGVIDLIADEEGGRALIIDYKTDRADPGDDLEARVERGYLIQREVYALAALDGGAQTVDVAHLFLERPGDPAVATYAAADAPRLRENIAARCDDVLHGPRTPTGRPGRFTCAGCPGRGTLCPYPEARTSA